MALKAVASLSCVSTALSSPFQSNKKSSRDGSFSIQKFDRERLQKVKVSKSCLFMHAKLRVKEKSAKRQYILFAISEDQLSNSELEPDISDPKQFHPTEEDISPAAISYVHPGGAEGKPGFISFYNRPYSREKKDLLSMPGKNQNVVLWFVGPAILVSSFIFPSLYLRRILSTIFEDSLLTDFLILFFSEALFYCGVAMFLLLTDRLKRPLEQESYAFVPNLGLPLGYRISSVTVLVLSLIIPMVTMGFVWPWTGPAASATLAPYLVGIVVQFAFEQYARHVKSPSWSAIPVIFQVYRLHQLNRAAQLVTALSLTVRGADMTPHNVAINSSLGTLLNVLQFLGVICIWSLASFIMRFFPAASIPE